MPDDPFELPVDELMTCHAGGPDPEGYDAEDVVCHNCLQKFTCLPAAAAAPDVWAAFAAKVWRVEDDHEVCALIDRQLTYEAALARIRERERLVDDGELIPADLLVRRITPGDRRKAAKRRPPPRQKPRVARHLTARNGGKLPLPKSIPEEEMRTVLDEKVKLGKRVEFEYGMQIVRRMRVKDEKTGERREHVVTVTKNGFLYDDKLYATLSAAAQNASGTPCRSGNDWFNLRTSKCTEVRRPDGSVLASRTVGD